MRARAVILLAAGVLVSGLVLLPQPRRASAVVLPPLRPTNPNDGVAWANYYRAFGENLPPITAGPSPGPQNVANWLAAYHLAGDAYCAHTPDATHPWPGGDNSHNVLFCGPPSLGQSIEGWVDTPYHGAGFVDPAVTAISLGFDYDTSAAKYETGGTPGLSRWPKPDGVLPSPSLPGGESPDPRAPCGYPAAPTPVGRPIFLTMPATATFGGATVTGPAGTVASCALHANPFEAGAPVLDVGEATRQVCILTMQPYQRGQTYTASIVMNGVPYTWSFLVGDVPAAPAVGASVTGPGQITVGWSAAEPHGFPVTGYGVDNVTTGASYPLDASARAATIGGLTPGATYTFHVTASNDAGVGPDASATAVAIGLPLPPTIVGAVGGDTTAVVSWVGAPTAAAPIASYELEVDGGAPVNVGYTGTYHLGGLTNGQVYKVRVRGVNAAGAGPWSTASTVAPHVPGRLFVGLAAPVRVADSRQAGGPVAAGTNRAIDVLSPTSAPASQVAAISLNLTATNTSGAGYLTAWPCDQPQPEASNVNYVGGEPGVPNHVIVPVALNGTVCVFAGVHGTDVIVDVDGWFSLNTGLVSHTPHRALDTRVAGGPRTDVAVAVAPAGASAAVLNVTAAGGSAVAGFVTAYPCGAAVPLASNLNFLAGQIVANAVVVPVGADGSVCLHASTPTDLLVDVAGFVIAGFVPTGPTRAVDTRTGSGPTTSIDVVAPPGATGAVLNITAAGGSTAAGYVTAFPADVPQPATSNLDFAAGQVVPNAAVVRPDGARRLRLTASTPVQLVVDVAGYFL